MGKRIANEILMLDKELTAASAVQCGFANEMITEDLGGDWFDLNKVPTIGKLLATDYRTLVNCKKLINFSKDSERTEKAIRQEGKMLVASWMEDDFPAKLYTFLQ